MIKFYDVYYNKQIVGSVERIDQGLYVRFHGALCLNKGIIWRVIGITEKTSVDFGIALFEGVNFIVDKKITQKKLRDKELLYLEVINDNKKAIELTSDGMFERLDLIEQGRLCPDNNSSIIFYDDHIF